MPIQPTEAALWFANALTMKFGGEEPGACTYYVDKAGRRFDRVMQASNYGGRSVHCFIERATGAVLKPAGLNAPVIDPRYDNPKQAIEFADKYGSYLYKEVATANCKKTETS